MSAALAAIPFVASEGTKLAGDVVGHVAAALNKSIFELDLGTQHMVGRGKRSHPVDVHTKFAIPAWLVLGGAMALWLLGLGIRPGPQGLALVERPRMLLPFTSSSGGSTSSPGSPGAIAGQIACAILPPPLNLVCSGLTALGGFHL